MGNNFSPDFSQKLLDKIDELTAIIMEQNQQIIVLTDKIKSLEL